MGLEAYMYRLFALSALCLAFAVTACNNGGKKRVTIHRDKPGQGDANASEKTRNLNKAIEDKKCLRVDKLLSEIVKLKDDTVVIYTSDLDLGLVGGAGPGADPSFESQVDAKVRAHAVLKNDREPILEALRARDIQSGSHISFLLLLSAIDEKCETAAFGGPAPATFEIFKKGPGALWMRNKKDPSELLFYQYNRRDKLSITHYTPITEKFCTAQPRMSKRKYIVAREEAADKLELDRGFAQMIADNIDEPAEMTQALGKDGSGRTGGGTVTLRFSVVKAVQDILKDDKFQRPVCPAP